MQYHQRNKRTTNSDIEIVEDGPNVKIHYVGYDEKYEWKPRSQILMKKPEDDRTDYSPFIELVSCIKKKLKAIRTDDPAVRIQVGFEYIHMLQ